MKRDIRTLLKLCSQSQACYQNPDLKETMLAKSVCIIYVRRHAAE